LSISANSEEILTLLKHSGEQIIEKQEKEKFIVNKNIPTNEEKMKKCFTDQSTNNQKANTEIYPASKEQTTNLNSRNGKFTFLCM